MIFGLLLRCGHIVPIPELIRVKNGHTVLFAKKILNTGFPCSILNGVKNGLSVLFAKKIRFSLFNTKLGFPCSILNRDQHGENTEFFSLKYGSQYKDLKPF